MIALENPERAGWSGIDDDWIGRASLTRLKPIQTDIDANRVRGLRESKLRFAILSCDAPVAVEFYDWLAVYMIGDFGDRYLSHGP